MIYTNEQIQEKFRELPIDLQKTITSMHSAEAIQAIGKNNGLLIDKIGVLGYETGLALIGLTPLSEFPQIITTKLGISFEKAQKITREINEEIFLKIRELMQKKQREKSLMEDETVEGEVVDGEDVTQPPHSDIEETPSRESVLAGIEDPKSISNQQSVNALSKPSSVTVPAQTPFARTVLAPKIAPPPINLPTVPAGILENKLQSVVRSTNPTPKQIVEQKAPSGITQITRDPYREAVE